MTDKPATLDKDRLDEQALIDMEWLTRHAGPGSLSRDRVLMVIDELRSMRAKHGDGSIDWKGHHDVLKRDGDKLHDRCAAAEKERDELRAALVVAERHLAKDHDLTYAKGREDERGDVVAWLRDSDSEVDIFGVAPHRTRRAREWQVTGRLVDGGRMGQD